MDKASAAKIATAGFADFAKLACAAELTSFRTQMIAYDMKAGWTRRKAEPDADGQISDAITDWSDRYRDMGTITAPK